ncbi:MAG TPA: hypothetical protein VMV81_03855 [Phycisphaerae bacterium]|nr:hypothetical protein [Phycisphaerae bacterium]
MKKFSLSALVFTFASAAALAQWSSNPALNLTLADRSGEQVQPKIRAATDGGAWVSWYDNSTGGYDVYIQRLDKTGVEQFAHNGVLLADRSVSSTVDYGLAVDANNNGLIAFTDDRGSQHVTAQKVSPAGALMWNGINGVSLTPASTIGSPPQVAALTDGSSVVIWNGTTSPIGTWIQKLDASGAPQFAGSGILQNDTQSPQRPLEACDVEPGDNGSFIVLFVRCTGTNCVTSNKQLYIQKYDASGAPQWNAGAPMALMLSTASIQTGTFPRFLPDGNGGAVVAWYETGGARNALMQHVLANGTLKFASPISNVGPTNPATRIRVGAGLAYNQSTGDYFVASPETDASTQSQNSLLVQRIDSTGALKWGDSGVTLLAITTLTQPAFVQSQIMDDSVVVYWEQTTSGTTRVVAAARVRTDATVLWNELLASDGTKDKSRLDSAASACGYGMVAYGNGPSGSVDIQAQNVRQSGLLGNPPTPLGDMNCDGVVNAEDVAAFSIALLDTAQFAALYPCCTTSLADMNGDLNINGGDINAFVQCVLGSCPP